MNKILRIVVAFLAITLTACKDDFIIIDPTHFCTFEMQNNLNEEVSISGVERLRNRPFEITLSSGESYSYWHELMGGSIEKDKVSVFFVSTIKFESKTYGICEFDSFERLGVYHEQWQGDLDCTTLVIDESLFRVQ